MVFVAKVFELLNRDRLSGVQGAGGAHKLAIFTIIIYKLNMFRFSCAKKCSNEGRALMQLDFQQFLIKLEKLTSLR